MNRLEVYDAVERYLSEKIGAGIEVEIYDDEDITKFMYEFDDWLKDVY